MMQVIIMRGIPGSGKTTYLESLQHDMETRQCLSCEWVSADGYFYESGVYKFDPTKLTEAHNSCLKAFLVGLQMNNDLAFDCIGVDNTNISVAEIAPYYQLASALGWEVKIIRIHCDPVIAYKRNVHNVPLSKIISMHNRMITETLPPWWKEEIVISE
jgi:tRNA uridine 5-carbamoylmethylation protein Kti12